ncbi:hypothetical protein HGRIS_004706 [Hohenbuehelia grisea]|uniref:AMP-dependent synthetase/ligase domain-containing protein n=1 Tax=Hohenbuehelia grisea TaxID=104357 RepID=A0ABR3JCS3_9AGAR
MAGASGVMQMLFSASAGMVIAGFKPSSPAIIATPSNVWDNLGHTKADFGFVLPPLLNIWAQDPLKVAGMAKLDGILYGGGPVASPIGDKLAHNGVALFPLFGSSEGGLMNTVFTSGLGRDWEYFSFYLLCNPAFKSLEDDDRSVELIIKSGAYHRPTRFNTDFDGAPAFATGDVLVQHPSKPRLWKFSCREDDRETLPTGTKINARALERIMMAHSAITGAVVFSSRSGIGAIIDLSKECVDKQLSVFDTQQAIRSALENVNAVTAPDVKLTIERCLFTSVDRPFAYGEKGMPRRQHAKAQYKREIDELSL